MLKWEGVICGCIYARAHKYTNTYACRTALLCSAAPYCNQQQCDSPVTEGWASTGVASRAAEETKSLTSWLRYPPSSSSHPVSAPSIPPVTMCVITGAPRDADIQACALTHTLLQTAGSHPAKSLIHMPSQPILTRHVGYGRACR